MHTIMNTASIRQKLHSYLEVADDKKIKAIYAIIENDIAESALEYSNEIKKELDMRYGSYKSGKAKIITADESKKRVQKILKTARRK